jgi:hypothetical protein
VSSALARGLAVLAIAIAPSRVGLPMPALSPGVTTHPISVNLVNWSPFAMFASRTPAWYSDSSGVVHLEGAATQVSSAGPDANLLGTLPKAASPSRSVYFVVHTFAGTYADLGIEPNGKILMIDPRPPAVKDYTFVSLEGITFRRSGTVHAIAVNHTNWSASARFGSTSPAWYTDRSGLVHLQGAARQTSTTGRNAELVGTLPKAARPASSLYFIVHTFAGTYADLGIVPSGKILMIDPRPPAVKDYTFVSLEGITFRRSGSVHAIFVHTADWSARAHFGSRSPGWYTDRSGIVHLQGAVRQTSTAGPEPLLIGSLPSAAIPSDALFFIVHTFAGTYADLEIGTDGSIVLINPRPPAVKDYTFVSLEGISFRR